jgi:DNA modification methylase
MADVAEPEKDERWLSAEDVASRLGITAHRVVALARRDRLVVRGSARDPFVRESSLGAIWAAHLRDPKATSKGGSTSGQPGQLTEANRPSAHEVEVDRLIVGDALGVIRSLPSNFAQAVVTSPPFWGQRTYEDETTVGWRGGEQVAFGREETPAEYAIHSAEVLVELARVIKPRGTIWWNVGDAYWTRTILHDSSMERINHYGGKRSVWAETADKRASAGHAFLKDKDLTLVPFLVALEAQRAGLWLRSVIVWSKQRQSASIETDGHNGHEKEIRAHMPEPVADRPVTGHEYILLFAKSEAYDYHASALSDVKGDTAGLNVRTVWTFRPVDSAAAHGARFPEELPRRCIALGTSEGDLVLDPFSGHGTTLKVAAEMGRHYLGVEISPTYAREARATIGTAHASQLLPVGQTG